MNVVIFFYLPCLIRKKHYSTQYALWYNKILEVSTQIKKYRGDIKLSQEELEEKVYVSRLLSLYINFVIQTITNCITAAAINV